MTLPNGGVLESIPLFRCGNHDINKRVSNSHNSEFDTRITQLSYICEVIVVAAGEEAVDVGLGVPVFVAVAGVAKETIVAETLQVLVFDTQ